jgi:hypothetical protein
MLTARRVIRIILGLGDREFNRWPAERYDRRAIENRISCLIGWHCQDLPSMISVVEKWGGK